MPKDFHDEFLTFSLDMQHLITIRGTELRFVYLANGVATFHAVESARYMVNYEVSELNRMNRAGEITVVPYGLLPEHQRPFPVFDDENEYIAGLPSAKRKKLAYHYSMVRSFEYLLENNIIKGSDSSIQKNMDVIRFEAERYFQQEMPSPAYSEQLKNWQEGKGRKPRTPIETAYPGACSPRQLREWVYKYRKGGKIALINRSAKQGNVRVPFSVEELALMAEVVRSEYMKRGGNTIAGVVSDVNLRFRTENEARRSQGLPPLKVPGRDAIRSFIKRLDKFSVYVAQHGLERAMREFRPVTKGVEVSRPFQRVEMDEQMIDVIAAMAYSGLLAFFDQDELKRLGFFDKTKRWWMTLAIDCRTRCILGMVLTCEPRSSAALKCLRMVVSDKGAFANMVGAKAPWSIFGTPETLVTDNGPAFKSLLFTSACTDLGITAIQTIAGLPTMRGIVERIFGTVSSKLMSRLSGRTFSDVTKRGSYDAEKHACLNLEQLATILVRWAVDVYHNTRHDGLGGRTPLKQWETDLQNGNTPLRTAPSARRKHIALGVALARKLQKDGIRVMNVQYHSFELAKFFMQHGKRELEVRWNEENIGTIEVLFNDGWQTVPATLEAFRGVHASDWHLACRSLRTSDPERKEWEEYVVAEAIRDIKAINAEAKAAFHILDHAWTEKRLAEVEAEAMNGFKTVPSRAQTTDPRDGRGQAIIPVEPANPSEEATQIDSDRHALPTLTNSVDAINSGGSPESGPDSDNTLTKSGETARAVEAGSLQGLKRRGQRSNDTGYVFPASSREKGEMK